MWVILWGGVIIHVSGRRCFFSVTEMFSVVKLKKSFWFAAGCAGYCSAFMPFLIQVGRYNNICSESFLNLFGVVLFGYRRVMLPCVTVVFESFLRCTYFWYCLMNRDIWWGIFAALLVPPAEYSNFVCILSRYLLVSRFSLAYCRAICFFALVEVLIREYLSWTYILVFLVFLYWFWGC